MLSAICPATAAAFFFGRSSERPRPAINWELMLSSLLSAPRHEFLALKRPLKRFPITHHALFFAKDGDFDFDNDGREPNTVRSFRSLRLRLESQSGGTH